MQKRLGKFEEKLAQSEVDGILVTGQNNIYYLTGFLGDRGDCLHQWQASLVCD